MRKPAQDFVHVFSSRPRGQFRPRDHDDREFQLARGIDFGARAGAAGVARHDPFDAPHAQQVQFAVKRERASRDNEVRIRQRQRAFRGVDEPERVGVLRSCGERRDVLAADGEEHARRLIRQSRHRGRDLRNFDPAIAWHFGPWRALQRDQRRIRRSAGDNSVAADLGGEGMRCIDHMGDLFAGNIFGKPACAAETAGAGWQRLIDRDLRPSGIGIDRVKPRGGNGGCQSIGVARPAQNEGARHG